AWYRTDRSFCRALDGEFWQARADRSNEIIRALRDVWTRLVAVERRRAENAVAADLADWAPGEIVEAFGS
ncbi:MAG TPA: hypothetical protein VLM76_08405, partial [Patescibacteria group bacterium]|nr:hypothetical protein [Patescibacteria group bacterium]